MTTNAESEVAYICKNSRLNKSIRHGVANIVVSHHAILRQPGVPPIGDFFFVFTHLNNYSCSWLE